MNPKYRNDEDEEINDPLEEEGEESEEQLDDSQDEEEGNNEELESVDGNSFPVPEEDAELSTEHSQEEVNQSPRKSKRYRTLSKQLKDARATAYAEAQAREAESYKKEEALKLNEDIYQRMLNTTKENIAYRERSLNLEKNEILRAMANFRAEGEIEKEADAQGLLTKVYQSLSEVEKDKGNFERELAQTYASRHYAIKNNTPYSPPPKVTQQEADTWFKRNPWANVNDRENYDPELCKEAETYGEKLARQYKIEGRGDVVGSQQFFEDISKHMRSAYNLASPQSQTNNKMQSTQSAQSTRPVSENRSFQMKRPDLNVSRTAPNSQQQTPTSKDPYAHIKLEDAEKRMVKQMYRQGLFKSEKDAEIAYKQTRTQHPLFKNLGLS